MDVTRRERASSVNAEPGSGMDPALVELLDHLAEELAREYVRLMEEVAADERDDRDPNREEA